MDLEDVKAQAEKEFEQEKFREKVEMEKIRLRKRRSIWVKIWPWKLVRRDTPTPQDINDYRHENLKRELKQWYEWWLAEKTKVSELNSYVEQLKKQLAEKGIRPVC